MSITSIAVQGLKSAGNGSRYCYFLNATGAIGLLIYHFPVTEAGFAKTMTSLLIFTGVVSKSAIFFVMLNLSYDHDAFIFIVYEQNLSFENRLSTIIIRAQAVMSQIIR